MRKYFLFLMLVIASMVFVCKEYHEIPANAEIIGTEYVKYDKGLPVIELDSTKYAPTEIYTNNGLFTMRPVEGMAVTCFRIYDSPKVNFIAGKHSQEYLEEYFTLGIGSFIIFIIGLSLTCVLTFFILSKIYK